VQAMDIGQAFAFINEDVEWFKKVGIGAIVGAIPFINFSIFGYQVEVARNVAAGIERPLPQWQNFGKYFLDGLRIVGAGFVYSLPLILITICLSIALFFVAEPTSQPTSNAAPPPPEFFLIFGLMFACWLPYIIFIYALWPLFTIQIAREGDFWANFKLNEMWQLIRRQPIDYVLIVLLFFGLYIGVSILLIPAGLLLLIPCLGYIAYLLLSGGALILVMMVIGHLQGQFILNDEKTTAAQPPDDLSPDIMG